jgi:O-methyltransferase
VAGKTTVDFRINKLAVALIDCDLGTSGTIALEFLRPGLQNGTVIILDDYFAYRGSRKLGVAGAFEKFQRDHPELVFRRLFDYGHGGQGFVLEEATGCREGGVVQRPRTGVVATARRP